MLHLSLNPIESDHLVVLEMSIVDESFVTERTSEILFSFRIHCAFQPIPRSCSFIYYYEKALTGGLVV